LSLHAFALGVGEFLVETGKALGGDVLLIVKFPDLIFAFVLEAGILGMLHFKFQIVELIGEPRRSLGYGLVAAAKIVFFKILDVGVDNTRG